VILILIIDRLNTTYILHRIYLRQTVPFRVHRLPYRLLDHHITCNVLLRRMYIYIYIYIAPLSKADGSMHFSHALLGRKGCCLSRKLNCYIEASESVFSLMHACSLVEVQQTPQRANGNISTNQDRICVRRKRDEAVFDTHISGRHRRVQRRGNDTGMQTLYIYIYIYRQRLRQAGATTPWQQYASIQQPQQQQSYGPHSHTTSGGSRGQEEHVRPQTLEICTHDVDPFSRLNHAIKTLR